MTTCSMPDHGKKYAAAACCQPDSPSYMGEDARSSSKSTLAIDHGFWSDRSVWWSAAANTRNCLVGCSIGDFGMMFYLNMYHPGLPISLVMALAMATGLLTSIGLETVVLRVRESFPWRAALQMAFSMSIISMLGMEFAATATDYALTDGVIQFDSAWFWIALGISLLVGFLAPLPYNYFKLKKHGQACH